MHSWRYLISNIFKANDYLLYTLTPPHPELEDWLDIKVLYSSFKFSSSNAV